MIKEYCILSELSGSKIVRCIIRSGNLGSKMGYFLECLDIALKDFPNIDPKEVEIVQYGDRRFKGTYGIEFDVPMDVKIPYDYEGIHKVHRTL